MSNLRTSGDRAFDRQLKGPGFDTQRSGSVPFSTENFFNIIIIVVVIININYVIVANYIQGDC